ANDLSGEAEVASEHGEDVGDGVGVAGGGDSEALLGETEEAAGDAPPHVDGEVVADLVAENAGGFGGHLVLELEVLVHAGGVDEAGASGQEAEQGVEGGGFADARSGIGGAGDNK